MSHWKCGPGTHQISCKVYQNTASNCNRGCISGRSQMFSVLHRWTKHTQPDWLNLPLLSCNIYTGKSFDFLTILRTNRIYKWRRAWWDFYSLKDLNKTHIRTNTKLFAQFTWPPPPPPPTYTSLSLIIKIFFQFEGLTPPPPPTT